MTDAALRAEIDTLSTEELLLRLKLACARVAWVSEVMKDLNDHIHTHAELHEKAWGKGEAA